MKEVRVAYGFNLIFPSSHVVKILGMQDLDFVWLDVEHEPFTLENIENIYAERRTQPV
tara:strand:+ start:821 stop:994 length:174 start_codon:yes stop_codon:yes gene_type:complete